MNPAVFMVRQTNEREREIERERAMCLSDHLLACPDDVDRMDTTQIYSASDRTHEVDKMPLCFYSVFANNKNGWRAGGNEAVFARRQFAFGMFN